MARGTTFRTWDDYFIPGTSVLRNKFTTPGKPHGEPDPDKLRTMEEAAAAFRLEELRQHPIVGRFDYAHMKAIHGAIFKDVYEWAGQERTAPIGQFMVKEGHSYYPAGPQLTAAAEAEYAKIAAADYVQGLGRDDFVTELAERWGELNVVHSFREGNTRTQFVFFSELCEQAGHRLDTEVFKPGNPLREEFVKARFHSQDTGRNDQLAAVLDQAIAQPPPPGRDPGGDPGRGLSQGGPALRAASLPQAPSTARSMTPHPQSVAARAARRTGRSGPETGRG
ncbi:Fic/DOC family protein [Propionicicella superfundia]|uniref:Fic/DOC family protein n=1 Tax=Propionicicella superfundia TaxID=348582 RepID=UPI0009FF515F|nr:Fic family protein [Propionicicella superfundia]